VLSVATDYFIAERAVCNGVCPGHLQNCSCGKNGLAKVLFSLSVWLVKKRQLGQHQQHHIMWVNTLPKLPFGTPK
jgi:hypothetical protein